MKKTLIPAALVAALAVGVCGAKQPAKNEAADPAIMKVNGTEVPLSEFMYLYGKNNMQQLEPQTPQEYLDMFVIFKLKVADAIASGSDTTEAYRSELEQHKLALAKPYLVDSLLLKSYIDDIYGHMDRLVDVSHIMVSKGQNKAQRDSLHSLLDSIRTLIVTGKGDFEQLALKYSIDPRVRMDKGHMGWMKANAYPYTFEDVAYNTPKGEISQVMETPFGFHIIRVNDVKPNPGKVNVSHILKLTRGVSTSQAEVKKQQIDSIYEIVKDGSAATFSKVAKAESDDPGSANQGGQLPWFGVGEMVPEFETVAFGLKDGEVSQPFKSSFGYHIIYRHDHKGVPSLDDERDNIMRNINRDDRAQNIRKSQLDKYLKLYGGGLNAKGLKKVKKVVDKYQHADTAMYTIIEGMKKDVVATAGPKQLTASQVAMMLTPDADMPAAEWYDTFLEVAERELYQLVTDVAVDDLPNRYPDYANLLNEYRQGILLFDVSNNRVWNKASEDTEGLNTFFLANRDKYTWDKPHYKGTLLRAVNDSVAEAAKLFIAENAIPTDSLSAKLKEPFGRDVRVDNVLVVQGENPLIDHIAFGAEAPDLSSHRYKAWIMFDGRLIDAPEEAKDVKGIVTSDYQEALEKAWIAELKAKYPVEINQEVFDKIKNQSVK